MEDSKVFIQDHVTTIVNRPAHTITFTGKLCDILSLLEKLQNQIKEGK